MKERIADINKDCEVISLHMFYTEETQRFLVINLIMSSMHRIQLVTKCILLKNVSREIKIISCMGVANKMDPTRLQIADISKTHTDPLAKVIRLRFRKAGISKGLPVVFSDESPVVVREDVVDTVGKPEHQFVKLKCLPLQMHSSLLCRTCLCELGHE